MKECSPKCIDYSAEEILRDFLRIHSHFGYLSPTEYEEHYRENLEKNAVKIANQTLLKIEKFGYI